MKRFLFIVLCGIGCESLSFAEALDSSVASSDSAVVQIDVKDNEIKSDADTVVVEASVVSPEQAKVESIDVNIDVPAVEEHENADCKVSSSVNVVFDEAANSIDVCKTSTVLSDKIAELEKSKAEFPAQASDELAKFIAASQKVAASDLSKMSADERASLLNELSCSYNALMIILEETL